MKKTILGIVALTLAAVGAFADGVTVGGWGRAVFLPFVSQTGGDPQMTIGNSYGNTPEFGINVVGSSSNAGFEYDFKYTGAANIGTGNNAYVWVIPADGVKLALGKVIDWTMQGNAAFGDWDFLRFSYTGENFTFARVNTTGAVLSYTQGPLFSYAAVADILWGTAGGPAGFKLADLSKHTSVGVGYKVDGLGMIKAQSLGFANAAKYLYEVVNLGFDFTAVDNLWVSLGVFLNTDTDDHAFSNDSRVSGLMRYDAAASYTLDKLKINVLAEYLTRKTLNPNLELGVGLDFDLEDGVALTCDLRYLNKAAGVAQLGATDAVTGGFAGVKKSFGTGTIGIGVAYSTSTFATWDAALLTADDPTKAHFAIPVRVDYSF